MMIIVGIALVGILAGIMSGLFGIGGGIIMVPSLIAFLGMNILNANAASLAAMLLPVGILGVINYYKAGFISVKESLWISVGLFAGSFIGAELALSVNINLLAKLYAAFLLYVAVGYLNIPAFFKSKEIIKPANVETGSKKHKFWQFSFVGSLAGVIAGMFGKGGGIVIVPVLTKYFKYEPKAATATSLAALQLPVGLPSVIVYARGGHLNLLFAGIMALGLLGGVFFGSKLAIKMPVARFKRIYAVFLVCVAGYMVVKYL
jgi:uncharacterized protein